MCDKVAFYCDKAIAELNRQISEIEKIKNIKEITKDTEVPYVYPVNNSYDAILTIQNDRTSDYLKYIHRELAFFAGIIDEDEYNDECDMEKSMNDYYNSRKTHINPTIGELGYQSY